MKRKVAVFSPSTVAEIKYKKQVNMALDNLRKLGFEPITFFQNKETRGRERADLFNKILVDDSIDIILFTIGGYKAIELLPYIDYCKIQKTEKKIVGYSDCSLLLNSITTNTGLKTYLGPMLLPNFCEYPAPFKYTLKSFFHSIDDISWKKIKIPDKYFLGIIDWDGSEWGTRSRKSVDSNDELKFFKNSTNIENTLTGTLLGGNGDSLVNILNTEYFKVSSDTILFLEDNSDELSFENWIRIMTAFQIHGFFDKVKALIIGHMPHFSVTLIENFLISLNLKIPFVIGFPSGHIDPIVTLPIGGKVKIDFSKNEIMVKG